MKKCILLIVIALLFCGCSSEQNEDGSFGEDTAKEQDMVKRAQKETIWKVLDNKENIVCYLEDDDPNAAAVKDLIETHCSYVDNRSSDNLSLDKEMGLYTSGFGTSLNNNDYQDKVRQMYEDHELAVEQKEIIWMPSTFDEGLNDGKITVECEFSVVNASESYLEQMGMSIDTLYMEQRIYYVEKVDGKWLISNISKSVLDRAG